MLTRKTDERACPTSLTTAVGSGKSRVRQPVRASGYGKTSQSPNAPCSKIGFDRCQCGASCWVFGSEKGTGSTVKQCQECSRVVTLGRGWTDPALGVMLQREDYLGSWSTHKVAKGWLSHQSQVGT